MVPLWALTIAAAVGWIGFFVDTLILRAELNAYMQESGPIISSTDGFIQWTDGLRAFVLGLQESHDYLYPFGSVLVWAAPFGLAAVLSAAVFATWEDRFPALFKVIWVAAFAVAAVHSHFVGDAVRQMVFFFE